MGLLSLRRTREIVSEDFQQQQNHQQAQARKQPPNVNLSHRKAHDTPTPQNFRPSLRNLLNLFASADTDDLFPRLQQALENLTCFILSGNGSKPSATRPKRKGATT